MEGCCADLQQSSAYHQRRRICDSHAAASSIVRDGQWMRYCHACTCFHPLDEFDGDKKCALTLTLRSDCKVPSAALDLR